MNSVMKEDLNRLYDSKILSELDNHFAGFIERVSGSCVPEVLLAAALVSSYTRQGHICLELSRLEGKELLEENDDKGPVVCPKLEAWLEQLRKSPVVGKPGEQKPLILDDRSGLYLYRYWDYQEKLATLIGRRISENEEDIDDRLLKKGLDRLFGTGRAKDVDWQKIAAFASVKNRFCVISGGPGTGKTTTVANILALILDQPGSTNARIALAAPTGKAAARLQDAIKRAKDKLDCADGIKAAIPEEASTIHRLLGSIPGSPYFRHHLENSLPADVVVVDEASMVDLALLSKLVQALPVQAKLILLGDKDQLASVEAGAVLGDICDTGNVHSYSQGFCNNLKKVTGYEVQMQSNKKDKAMQDCIVQLQKNFRFGGKSGIGAVAHAVNAGDAHLASILLSSGKHDDIERRDLPRPDALPGAIKDAIIEGFAGYLKAKNPSEIFRLFDRFRILCALRQGPYGVIFLNSIIEQILKDEGLIESDKIWYSGRPVMITSNDYNMRLFNGDVGIVMPDTGAGNDLRAFFPAADGSLRKFHPLRLPEHETVYAMTVHKSQGSEFDKVLLLLPDKDYPVLTRELTYTGITRAKESVKIWANEDVFSTAVSRRTERMSGLRDALWET